MFLKRGVSAFLCAVLLGLALLPLVACGGEEQGRTVYTGSEEKKLSANESAEYVIEKEIGEDKYMTIEIETDVDLVGEMAYSSTDDMSKTTTEPFYIEAGEEVFRTFLDVYRKKGKIKPKLFKSITLKNVSGEEGNVILKKVSFTDRDMEAEYEDAEVFLEDDKIKIGIDLDWGGAIFYVERKNFGVKQIVDAEGYGSIITGDVPAGTTLVFEDGINLINTYDPGRLIQQSYYGMVYDPVTTLSYNPVQGGNGYGASQLVDYRVSEGEVYIKCRPNDWNKNETTCSYMENWYTLEDGVVRVRNRFTDFSGYDHSANDAIQEVPACYPIYPLNKFVCYQGDEPFRNKPLYEDENLTFWVGGGYHGFNVTESWTAWVSEENFGIGIYTPSVTSASAGRHTGTTFEEAKKIDGNASDLVQTTYSSMNVHFVMQTYESFEYTYFLMADFVDTMRATFYELNKTESNPFLADKNY